MLKFITNDDCVTWINASHITAMEESAELDGTLIQTTGCGGQAIRVKDKIVEIVARIAVAQEKERPPHCMKPMIIITSESLEFENKAGEPGHTYASIVMPKGIDMEEFYRRCIKLVWNMARAKNEPTSHS